jgi:hypothetical protein
MAHEEEPILTRPGSQPMVQHVNDYSRFTSILKWGAVACLAVAFLVLFIIS